MSYDIQLVDNNTKETLLLPEVHHMKGGTYAVNGTREAYFNITYNYAPIFRRSDVLGDDGIRTIHGLFGHESIPVLQRAIDALGDEKDVNYWAPTEGNAKKSLQCLLKLAEQLPEGLWDVG